MRKNIFGLPKYTAAIILRRLKNQKKNFLHQVLSRGTKNLAHEEFIPVHYFIYLI